MEDDPDDLKKLKSVEERLDHIDNLLEMAENKGKVIDSELSRLEKDIRRIEIRQKIRSFLQSIRFWND